MGASELAGSSRRRWGGSDGAELPAAVGLGTGITVSAGELLPAVMVLSGVAREPSLPAAGGCPQGLGKATTAISFCR